MARVCTVCTHPDRAAIDEALASGEPNRRVASRVGLQEASIRRHLERHLPGTLVKAQEAREVARADDLLGLLREAARDAQRLRRKAENTGDYRCAIAAVKTLADVVEKLADVGERLKTKGDDDGSPEKATTVAEFMRRCAVQREKRRQEELEGPLRGEWVNDWRSPASLEAGEATAEGDGAAEPETIPARLVS